jgi:shikimate dehydrogenase
MINLAVFGNPIAHSRSPEIHGLFAQQFGIALTYQKVLVPEDGLAQAVAELIRQGARGCNITVPFKSQALALCDEVKGDAIGLGVINTLDFAPNGRVYGYNTDAQGLITDLKDHLEQSIQGRKVLLIGAGGAAQGVVPALLREAPETLHVWNRTPERAEHLVHLVPSSQLLARTHEQLDAQYDLVINASAAGLKGSTPDLPSRIIGPNSFCYDLSYSDSETPFLRWASGLGAPHQADGFGMLIEQAAAAFHIWFGLSPDTQVVRTKMLGKSHP